MIAPLFAMLALMPASSPVPAAQVAPEVCEHHGPVYAAAQYRQNFLAECSDGQVFAFSTDGKSHIPAGRIEADTILTAYIPPHRKLSACRGHYFDRESVSISGHDLRLTWNRFHDREIYHYGRKSVTFDGVTFTNNTGRTAAVTAYLENV